MSRIYFCKMEFSLSKWNLLFQSTFFLLAFHLADLSALIYTILDESEMLNRSYHNKEQKK